ncbi:MAG: hypothetical protein KatS3mg082_0438 [Nitrospiraceae bacterium]|nr:MAG: hypothetical protein KatS3mg082_0438 [Nitrospiraceae bacterium]
MKIDGGHGGNVYAASRELGISIERVADFSASINPLGPSPLALRAIRDGRLSLRHYPESGLPRASVRLGRAMGTVS